MSIAHFIYGFIAGGATSLIFRWPAKWTHRPTEELSNVRMRDKLASGLCVDVNKVGTAISPGVYLLKRFQYGADYCDAKTEEWIWSIGENVHTGEVLAATDTRFFNNPRYHCLWLR